MLILPCEKFGKLRIKVPQSITSGSGKKIEWICDCGKEKLVQVYKVISGCTTSCGRCNEITAEEMAIRKFGKLQIKVPQSITSGSGKKIEWVCDCGKETIAIIDCVLSNITKSCGRCNEISAEEISKRKFGKLRIKISQSIKPNSHKKIEWICDCGKETIKHINNVMSGDTTSCGRCNEISAEEMSTKKFGKLRIKIPQNTLPGSHKKIFWICDCGKEKLIQTCKVLSNDTVSCGGCHETVHDWYFKNRKKIKSLKYPILPEQVPMNGVIPLEIIKHSKHRFQTICPACKKPWTALWNDIRLGKSLTCGCSSFRVSGPQRVIYEFIRQFDPNVQLEHKLGPFSYDIFIPSRNALIEFDGMLYHSSEYSKKKDLRKQKLALDSGYKFIRILEKDWKNNKQEVFNTLLRVK